MGQILVVTRLLLHIEFQKNDGRNEELLKSVNGVDCAFGEITSYAFPHPGGSIARASVDKKDWKISGEDVAVDDLQ